MSRSTMSEAERAWRDEQFGHWHNSGLNGQFKGYTCEGPVRYEKRWWLTPSVGIYDFRLSEHHPLTLIAGKQFGRVGLPQGTMIQPAKLYDTDKGSIPALLHQLFERDRFLAFLLHDAQYEFSECWIKLPRKRDWIPWPCTRWQADYMLMLGVGAQDGNALDRSLIYHAVRIGGHWVWNPVKKAALRATRRTRGETVQPGADRPS